MTVIRIKTGDHEIVVDHPTQSIQNASEMALSLWHSTRDPQQSAGERLGFLPHVDVEETQPIRLQPDWGGGS